MAEPSTRDVLRCARALITKPECWTQHALGRGPADAPRAPTDPAACSWCAAGAIVRAGLLLNAGDVLTQDAYEAATRALPEKSLSLMSWNDAPDRKHAEVIKVFNRAIAAEGKRRG